MYQFKSDLMRINQHLIREYIASKGVDYFSQQSMAQQLEGLNCENVGVSLQLIQNWAMPNNEKISDFLSYFYSRSSICTLIGARRQGKTVFLTWLGEDAHKKQKRDIFVYNMSKELPPYFQRRIFNKDKPYFDCSNNSLILHDECHLDIDSKNWNSIPMKNVREWASTTGHRNQSIIWTSQLASNIGLDMIRYCSIKMYKGFSLTQEATDRQEYFYSISSFLPETKSQVLIQTEDFFTSFTHPMPLFFTDKISRAFQ